MKCKLCNSKTKQSEFSYLFTHEALDDIPCSLECQHEQIEQQRKIVDIETKRHPGWFGPINQDEL